MTAGLLLGLVLAQSAPGEPSTADLERFRKALAEPAPVSVTAVGKDGPVFRVRIEAFKLDPAWTDRSIVPPYVRTWFRGAHHEFLEQVTPEEFRSATLYPTGYPVDVIARLLAKEFKAALRASQRRHAREEVSQDLAAFLACRTDSSKPGC